MKQMRLTKLAIAGSTVACAALFSFSWSEQRGVSLSVESAQARVGRPLTPMSVAGVARRQNRRAYRYDAAGIAGPMAVNYAGIAAAAGTAAAVGAATSPGWGWGGGPSYTGTGYHAGGEALGSNAYYPASTTSPSGWYITPTGMACTSGTWVTGANGLPFHCP
jgi:hypothetical protein